MRAGKAGHPMGSMVRGLASGKRRGFQCSHRCIDRTQYKWQKNKEEEMKEGGRDDSDW